MVRLTSWRFLATSVSSHRRYAFTSQFIMNVTPHREPPLTPPAPSGTPAQAGAMVRNFALVYGEMAAERAPGLQRVAAVGEGATETHTRTRSTTWVGVGMGVVDTSPNGGWRVGMAALVSAGRGPGAQNSRVACLLLLGGVAAGHASVRAA